MKSEFEIGKQLAYGRAKISVINADGTIAESRDWQNNLILDNGLNWLGANGYSWASCWDGCCVGTGTLPTYDDSGSIQGSQSENIITSNSGFFTSSDIGKLLKFDSGEECYIIDYIDSTQVLVNTNVTVSLSEFTLWRVNQTNLESLSKYTTTILSGGNYNGVTVIDDNTRRFKRTWDFSAETSEKSYTELGFYHSYNSNPNTRGLFSRILISGGAVTLQSGQQLRVTYEVTITIPNVYQEINGTMNITGWPVAPSTSLNGIYKLTTYDLSIVRADGSSGGDGIFDPNYTSRYIGLSTSSEVPANGGNFAYNWSQQAWPSTYVNNSFEITWGATFPVSNGNSKSIRRISIGCGSSTQYFGFVFDEPQTKTDTHNLHISFKNSWGRTLINP